MEREAVLDYFIYNDKVQSTDNMDIFDQISKNAVYEVIKIVDGIPLFFNEHLERMKNSLKGFKKTLNKSEEEILKNIVKLVELNKEDFINVKLVYDFLDGKDIFLTYFIDSEYPQDEKYRKGIHTITFTGERNNPNIKTISGSYKSRVRKAREENNAFEALLVDEEGYITEGSRSNIFFIKNKRIITPPGGQVLLGVTRNYVIKLCEELNISVSEGLISLNQLKELEGAFITGTTVDVLPISSIDNIQLSTPNNHIMESIIQSYNKKMEDNIRELRGFLKDKAII
ncbi:MAG TPA: aminotransferase class IV [Eubacteriaceae bacterium]|jgi:branched-chain amino acid aminotransferase|nr:aminotransferase class IV [Eubacteriaceae bacterium]